MGKIIVSEFISLDGVIEAPETWHFPYLSDDMQQYINEQIFATDASLYGRVTYEAFASFWPTASNDETGGLADKLNNAPKYVVSTTLEKADWNNSTLIKDIEELKRVKQQVNGNISIIGSATLIQSLMDANLIDEYQLMIHPIVVGKGKRLFKDGPNTAPLKLVSTRVFDGGVILAIHHPAE
jgi:dihydrofolate reductase